jgi:hypothetical protein
LTSDAAAAAAAKLPLPLRRRRAAVTAASAIVMPAALGGAILTLQALHEEQRLLFFAESLVRLHRWHCQEAATAKLGRHSAENQKWKWGILWWCHGGKFGKRRQYQFRLVELTRGALGTDQNSAPYIKRRESQREAQLSMVVAEKVLLTFFS